MALADTIYTRRIEQDIGGAVHDTGRAFELNLDLDTVAELVALDMFQSIEIDLPVADVEVMSGAMWFSLDPDHVDFAHAEESDDMLVYREVKGIWMSVAAAQEYGNYQAMNEFLHFPPGILTAVNPVMGVYMQNVEARHEAEMCLYYKIRKPSPNELAVLVARRR